jgi:hypothetical protein
LDRAASGEFIRKCLVQKIEENRPAGRSLSKKVAKEDRVTWLIMLMFRDLFFLSSTVWFVSRTTLQTIQVSLSLSKKQQIVSENPC